MATERKRSSISSNKNFLCVVILLQSIYRNLGYYLVIQYFFINSIQYDFQFKQTVILTLQRPHHSMRQSIGIAPVWCINAQCFKSRTHVTLVVSRTHCGTWRSSMSISYLTFSSQRTPWNSTAERKRPLQVVEHCWVLYIIISGVGTHVFIKPS